MGVDQPRVPADQRGRSCFVSQIYWTEYANLPVEWLHSSAVPIKRRNNKKIVGLKIKDIT